MRVVIIGGGHNALVAATYLARAGVDVDVLERLAHVGGAAVSEAPFAGVPARLSRFAYLVSLMPQALIDDLSLPIALVDRHVASYTPYTGDEGPTGLLVTDDHQVTDDSFGHLPDGFTEHEAWQVFYDDADRLSAVLRDGLLSRLPTSDDVRSGLDARVWRDLVSAPLGSALRRRFSSDLVRGVVATDALIGTFASLDEPSLKQNRCFLYHVLGGPWRVPVGGMGAVSGALAGAATEAGARIRTGAVVTGVEPGQRGARVHARAAGTDVALDADWVLSGVSSVVLASLTTRAQVPRPVGAQLKLNMLLSRLPRLRSGIDPETAFAGTFHVGETYSRLEQVYGLASTGRLAQVDSLPGEIYCHTLADPSILPPELAGSGAHTLTYFGLHVPYGARVDRRRLVEAALAGIQEHLAEPLEDLLIRDAQGRPCLEAKLPEDVERELWMPGGHIFHGDLSWPWLADDDRRSDPAHAWGVATPYPRVLMAGSSAVRGGAVSGIAGHNAAHALLELTS